MRYTLDRIEGNQYVFLEQPEEINELVIPKELVRVEVSEGDIVNIEKRKSEYLIEILKEETEDMREKVIDLIEKLKNKN